MKVFKFNHDGYDYAFFAKTEELAIAEFKQTIADEDFSFKEIPQSEWDKKTIDVFEDNQFDKKSYKVSISDLISGDEPQMIYTNDYSIID